VKIIFTVPGRITGKERPRFGHGHMYTPQKTASHETMVGYLALQAMAGKPLMEGPVVLTVKVNRRMPKKMPPRVRAGLLHWIGRPDADNQGKLVMDGCSRVCWKDDAQISDLHVIRRYAERDSVEITIEEVTMTDINREQFEASHALCEMAGRSDQ